jgi:hypothetical protein
MTPNLQRLQRLSAITVISYFIAFTAMCWLLDFIGSDHLASQTRASAAFDAGVVDGIIALICSLALRRSHPKLAAAGFAACALWTVWICLPRF